MTDGNTIQSRMQAALAHHQAGRIAEAVAIYESVLASEPQNADALHLLGYATHQLGNSERGIELIRRAIDANRTAPDFHSNLGGIYALQERFAEAVDALRRATSLRSTDPALYFRLAACCERAGRNAEAIATYREGLWLKPDAHVQAVRLGILLTDADRHAEAVPVLERAVAGMPDSAEAIANLGVALTRLRRHEDAVVRFKRSIELKPDIAAVHMNLGTAFLALGRCDEAVAAQRRALELAPEKISAKLNLAISLGHVGQFDDALALHEEILKSEPDHPTALFNRGIIRLSRGEYPAGWADYEARFRVPELKGQQSFPQPRWSGEDVSGKTILVHGEQGLGDMIQFIRYVPAIVSRGANVIVQCDRLLLRLLQHSFTNVQIIPRGEPLPSFELHVAVMSLPHVFGTTLETVPSGVPYVITPPESDLKMNERLSPNDGVKLRVGLVWAGNPDHYNDRNRSIPLDQLLPALAAVEGVQLFSLQKGPGAEQLALLGVETNVIDLAPGFQDLADTAAAIKRLDLVISVDTGVAHLAGALGAKTWVLLPARADFRWLIDRDDSPWYPMMRLFRRTRDGDWPEVAARVAAALRVKP